MKRYNGVQLAAITAILVLSCNQKAKAADDWSDSDTIRQATFLAIDAMDWAQTRTIARNPDKYYEKGDNLPMHPTVSQVDNHFISGMIINTAIAYMLPAEYRAKFQYLSIGYEIAYVRGNMQVGVAMKF